MDIEIGGCVLHRWPFVCVQLNIDISILSYVLNMKRAARHCMTWFGMVFDKAGQHDSFAYSTPYAILHSYHIFLFHLNHTLFLWVTLLVPAHTLPPYLFHRHTYTQIAHKIHLTNVLSMPSNVLEHGNYNGTNSTRFWYASLRSRFRQHGLWMRLLFNSI